MGLPVSGIPFPAAGIEIMRTLFRCLLVAALWPLAAGCRREKPDILLITVDTLRADRLGTYGSTLGLTPSLDRFAQDALVFDQAYAVAPITTPSLSSAFTSHYPHETKVTDNGLRIPAGVPTLAELLRREGYETAAVVSNPVLAEPGRLDPGFDVYDDSLPEQEKYRDEPARRAGRTTDAALALWRTRKSKPFFLWVHYMDPHGPYQAPDSFVERATRATGPEDRTLAVSADNRSGGAIPRYQYIEGCRSSRDYLVRYNAAVAYLDSQIGRLLSDPQISRLRTEGLILFTADHGEALGEHDTWFAHGENVYDEMIHVPWIVAGRGVRAGRRTDAVSLIDLMPSLFDELGFPISGEWRGLPVFRSPGPGDRVVFAATFPASSTAQRYAAVSSSASAILSVPGGWECYGSPEQTVDVSAGQSSAMRLLARRLLAELSRNDLANLVPEAPERVGSPEALQRLRSLGYL
jgi:arylsulfatase A-like enzyme